MGYVLLGDTIEIDQISLKKYNQNIHSLHSLCISLNNVMEDSKHYVSQVEAFMASSFTLSSDLHKIGLQFNDIGTISSSITQLNREISSLLPQSLRDCKIILDFSTDNQVFFDHTETFKNIKQEIDKYLLDSIQYRRDLKSYLLKYQKSPTESNSDKIASIMAKLNLSINFYEKYLTQLERELSEFCGTRHKYLLDLSKNIFNLHHLVHFGRKLTDETLNHINSIKQLSSKSNLHPLPLKHKVPPSTLRDIVDNPIFLKSLRIFSEKQHCLESLLFWLDANALKELEATSFPREKIRSLFVNMCNSYIEPDCPYEINIDSESKSLIDKRKANLDSNNPFYPAFSSAVDSIFSLLNFSTLPLFFKSPIYNAALMMSRSYSEESLDGKGISHVLCSLDSILNNPISLEYFLAFIKSQNSPPSTPSSTSPSSLSPSPSFIGGLSGINNNSLSPPLALPYTPKLSPLLPTFSPNLVTLQDIENMLYFYLDINKFKDITNEEDLENTANELFETYLKPTSEKRIVPISTLGILEVINSRNITRDLFQGVSQDIILHIANVYFPSFLTSQICKDMLAREEKMKRFQEKEDKKKQELKIELQLELIGKEKLRTVIPNKIRSLLTSNIMNVVNSITPSNNNNNNNINNSSNNNATPISPPITPTTTPPNPITSTFIPSQLPNRTPSPPGGFSTTSIVHLDENKSNFINSNNRNRPTTPQHSLPTTPQHSLPTTPILPSNNSQVTLPPLPSSSNHNVSSNNLNSSSTSIPPLSVSSSQQSLLSSSTSSLGSSSTTPPLQSSSSGSNTPTGAPLSFSVSVSLFKDNNNSDNQEESRSNDVFLYILTDSVWLDGYKKFVRSEKSEELLLCWMELEAFFKNPTVNKLHASIIYENFFKEGSPLEVSITDSDLRSQLKSSLNSTEEQISIAFKIATEEIVQAMRTDTFSRFNKSQIFKDLVKENGDPSDPKNRRGLQRKKKLNASSSSSTTTSKS